MTGANHGIGAATAHALAARGARVLVTGLALDEPRDPGIPAAYYQPGPVRILANNATGWVGDSFTGAATDHVERQLRPVSAATHDQQFAVDARAGGLLISEFAQRHLARGDDWGRIVSLTSGGPDGFPGEASYGAAKAALDNYTMSAAGELGGVGITANSLMPPVTDTGWVTDAVREFVPGSWAHHHVATPEQVATTIAWLCSDDAWLVTGNRIVLR